MTDCFIEENAMKSYGGIDVGAQSVVVSVRRAGRVTSTNTFPQTPEGHQALFKYPAASIIWPNPS